MAGARTKLNVHHIESRKTGGDSPGNLVTLCEYCHGQLHKGKVKLGLKRGTSYRNAAFMGIMRWSFYNKLKEEYDGQECFIFGRRSSGYFDLRKLDGTVIHRSASYRKLILLDAAKHYLAERRTAFPPMTKVTGLHA